MGKKLILSLILVLGGVIFFTSLAKGDDLDVEPKNTVYYDSLRDADVEIIFYKKAAYLAGKNFGPKIKLLKDSEDVYKNEKNNLILLKKDDEVIVFIGKKKIFEGLPQEDDNYKNINKNALVNNVWLWKNTITKGDESLKPNNPNLFNLSFTQDGKIFTTTDCADFEGSYELKGDKVKISNLTQKKQICGNSEGEEFIKFLNHVDSFDFNTDNNLILFLKDDNGSMSFMKK